MIDEALRQVWRLGGIGGQKLTEVKSWRGGLQAKDLTHEAVVAYEGECENTVKSVNSF